MDCAIEQFRSQAKCGCIFLVRILHEKDFSQGGVLNQVCCKEHDWQATEGAIKYGTSDPKHIQELRDHTIY
jgi:hypothetical protein